MNRRYVWVIIAIVVSLDQWTKHLLVLHYAPGESHDLLPGLLSLTYVQNTGGAFGILQHSTMLLAVAAVIAVGAVGLYLSRRDTQLSRLAAFAIALPVGGAVGNLVDRLRLKYVVDFLDAHIGTHQWPVFNVADSAICVGVGLLILINWKSSAEAGTRAVPAKE